MELLVTKTFEDLLDCPSRIAILEGSSRCFSAEQLVVTETGSKPISEIQVGDKVLSYNEATGENEFKRVKGLHCFNNEGECYRITLKNGTVIECTAEHEFYYEGAWVPISKLLIDCDGFLESCVYETITLPVVYDIAVEDNTNYYLKNGDDKILVHNSGKTYATCQFILHYCLTHERKMVTVARDNLVVAKRTVMLDFEEILDKSGISYERNKTECTYKIGSSTVRFIGLDDVGKIHGLKQDVLYVNEGLTIAEDKYRQLFQRTTGRIIIDYNPSATHHFLYEWADRRSDTTLYKSTVFDNPLVPELVKEQILSYEPNDVNLAQGTANEFYWRVYGLGERFQGEDVVFPRVFTYSEEVEYEWMLYGGDFGYTNPSAVVCVKKQGNNIFLKVVLYSTGLTNEQIANQIKASDIDLNCLQIWDSAEPKSIQELRLNDINAVAARKGQDSVAFGFQKLKNFNIYVHEGAESKPLLSEMRNLRYMTDSNGNILYDTKNRPMIGKQERHCLDAVRYAVDFYL